jgi:hypothetical protein
MGSRSVVGKPISLNVPRLDKGSVLIFLCVRQSTGTAVRYEHQSRWTAAVTTTACLLVHSGK